MMIIIVTFSALDSWLRCHSCTYTWNVAIINVSLKIVLNQHRSYQTKCISVIFMVKMMITIKSGGRG